MKRMVIWGAGKMAENLRKCFDDSKVEIIAYVDSNSEKHGMKFLGVEIISPEDLCSLEYDYIYISSIKYQQDILEQLKKLAVERDKIIMATASYDDMGKLMDIVTEKGMIFISYMSTTAREQENARRFKMSISNINSKLENTKNIITNRINIELHKADHKYLKNYYEEDAAKFIADVFVENEDAPGKQVLFDSRKAYFDYVLDYLKCKDGLYLEFGVWKGDSINYLAEHIGANKIYGFDCFEGLPEDWIPNCNSLLHDTQGQLPEVRDNVELVKGMFDETLPGFLEQHRGEKCSLIHIDSDLYSSAKYVLMTLKDYIGSGTVICFDEFAGHIGWREDEYKAFMEFVEETGCRYKYIAGLYATNYCRNGERVAIEIL